MNDLPFSEQLADLEQRMMAGENVGVDLERVFVEAYHRDKDEMEEARRLIWKYQSMDWDNYKPVPADFIPRTWVDVNGTTVEETIFTLFDGRKTVGVLLTPKDDLANAPMIERPEIEAIEDRQRRLDYNLVYHESPHESGLFMLGDELYRSKEAQLSAIPDLLAYIKALELVNAAPANPPVTPGTGGDR